MENQSSPAAGELRIPQMSTIAFAFFTLCFVFFVIFLYLYMLWQRDHRLSRRRVVIFSAACSGGLDSAVLVSLPVVAFFPGDGEKKEKVMECAICLGEYVEGEKVRLLLGCNHRFHVECIDAWLAAHTTCPLCRAAVHLAANPPLPAAPPV